MTGPVRQAPTTEKILDIVAKSGVLRPRDLDDYGIPRKYLHWLRQKGLLKRVARGLYVLPDAEPTENRTLVEVCKRVPGGVVCLLSALQFHGLTTQMPFEVWLAIDRKAWLPNERRLPIHIVRFSGAALVEDVEEHPVEGGLVRIYNVPKTVADCFKYRNKIGMDVALESLRDCWDRRRATMDELWQAARVCRVANVMQPYLESLT